MSENLNNERQETNNSDGRLRQLEDPKIDLSQSNDSDVTVKTELATDVATAPQTMCSSVRNISHEEIGMLTDIKQFKRYGAAVYLLFAFIKKVSILFVILSLVSLIPISYNIATGKAYSQHAWSLNAQFARASLGSHSSSENNQSTAKYLNQGIIIINLTICFCFWLYWKSFMESESAKIENDIQLSNYSEVILQGNFNGTCELQVCQFMEQFGRVRQVVQVAYHGELISIAKKICQNKQNSQKIVNRIIEAGNQSKFHAIVKQNQRELEKLYKDFNMAAVPILKSQPKIIRYYIQMDSHQHQKVAIERSLQSHTFCCDVPPEFMLKDQAVSITRCLSESIGIYWQNQHVGFKELILPNIILLLLVNVITILTMLIFSLISVLQVAVYYDLSLSTNNLSQSQIIKQIDSSVIGSWCLSNDYSQSLSTYCSPYLTIQIHRIFIYFAIAFTMVAARLCIKKAILSQAQNLRFKNYAQQSIGLVFHLFINYTMIGVVVALSVQTNLFGTAMSDLFAAFITAQPAHSRLKSLMQYYDYDSQWYLDYGFQLLVNYLIFIVCLNIIAPCCEYLLIKIKARLKKDEHSQVELVEFEMEDHYACVMAEIVVGIVFAGGMPILFPLILLALITKFIAIKYLFVYANRPPMCTDRLQAQIIPTILMVALVAYTLNSVWALGVESIFQPSINLFQSQGIDNHSNAHTIPEALMVFIRRQVNAWPLLLVFIFGIMLVNLRKRLSNLWMTVIRTITKESSSKEQNFEMHHMQHQQVNSSLKSYRPINNKRYRKIFQQMNNSLERISH